MSTLAQKIFRHKFLLLFFIVSIGSGAWYVTRPPKGPTYETSTVRKGDVIQEVSVTGRVESDNIAELSFERSGRVITVPVQVGTLVKKGETVIRLDSQEIETLRKQARANLDVELARLAELKTGVRKEDINISSARLEGTKISVLDAKIALEDKLNTARTVADDSVFNKTDTLFNNPRTTSPQLSFPVSDVSFLFRIESARLSLTERLKLMSHFGDDLDVVLVRDKKYFTDLKLYFDNLALAINSLQPTPTYSQALIESRRADVALARMNLNNAFTAVLNAEQVYRSAVTSQMIAESELALKQVGPTNESIAAQEARIDSMRATIENYNAQLTKSVILAPFSGMITRQDAKLGETASPNITMMTIMSDNNYKVTVNVPEVDVAKLIVDQGARITLDAYGPDVLFHATIASIDPAETVIQGVSTYKVTLRFAEKDSRIRSGMTANINILTAKKEGALYIPARSIITKGGKKYVKIPSGLTATQEQEVTVGLRGSDGSIEILSGLREGETIVTFEQKS